MNSWRHPIPCFYGASLGSILGKNNSNMIDEYKEMWLYFRWVSSYMLTDEIQAKEAGN